MVTAPKDSLLPSDPVKRNVWGLSEIAEKFAALLGEPD
jgi:hypothetical protein